MRTRAKKRPRARRDDATFQNQIELVLTRFVERTVPSPTRLPPTRTTLAEATKQFQLAYVGRALEEHRYQDRWNISAAASALGVSRSFLYGLLEDLRSTKLFAHKRKRRSGRKNPASLRG